MDNHKSVIVRKPWGYEYLAYQNAYVALWVLHIQSGERTSMHCHPLKSTGLVVLEGTAKINFISDNKILEAPAKQMIRRGLFHQTHAFGENGVVMFEVETPVDKDDLIRLHDNYGRQQSGYENSNFQLPKTEECIWIDNPIETIREYVFGNRKITVENATPNVFDKKSPNDILMFLQGGLIKTVNGRTHMATMPGDVGTVNVVSHVAKEMDGFADNTIIMTIQ